MKNESSRKRSLHRTAMVERSRVLVAVQEVSGLNSGAGFKFFDKKFYIFSNFRILRTFNRLPRIQKT